MTPTNIAAIVPMRHDSERVPRKNYRDFCGKPLFHRILTSLFESKVTTVVVDTDSQVIVDDIRSSFPDTKILDRPEHLRDGNISMNQVLANSIEQVDADIYLQTHSTNPLLSSETIDRAIEAFLMSPENDSLFSVTRWQTRLYSESGHAINHDPEVLLRTQDLPPIYEENSNLYIFSKESFSANGNRIGRKPMLFEIDKGEAWDIDEEIDFVIAELLFSRRSNMER